MTLELIKHEDRSIIELQGSDSREFLQGLITNDIHKIDSDGLIYCAMLSPKGRFLYDIFIFKGNNSLFLDVFASKSDEIVKKLGFYKLKKDVSIVKKDNIGTYSSFNSDFSSDFGHVFADPRSKNMGLRAYFDDSKLENKATCDIAEYEFNRIKHKIPESEKDMTPDKSIVVELGLDDFNAIDYEKGCYVGQELTARTHHLGQVRKKIFFCKYDSENAPEKNTEIFANNQKIGLALSSIKYNNITYGLIFIKVDESFNKDDVNLSANNIKIEILN